jgi:hypothetical protein
VIFVGADVVMYAVGRPHPLRDEARQFFLNAIENGGPRLCTSAEVMQELMDAYIPVGRMETLDAAMTLVEQRIDTIEPLDPEDVLLARTLASQKPGLGARDLVHLAFCQRRGITEIKTFDRGLSSTFPGPRRRGGGR